MPSSLSINPVEAVGSTLGQQLEAGCRCPFKPAANQPPSKGTAGEAHLHYSSAQSCPTTDIPLSPCSSRSSLIVFAGAGPR